MLASFVSVPEAAIDLIPTTRLIESFPASGKVRLPGCDREESNPPNVKLPKTGGWPEANVNHLALLMNGRMLTVDSPRSVAIRKTWNEVLLLQLSHQSCGAIANV